MKIAVTSSGKGLNDQVDPRFGRCPYFLIVETHSMEIQAIDNPNLSLGGGAGIQSSQLVADQGVEAVLTGNCGPNAYQTLSAAGVDVIVGVSGTVEEAVDMFKSGKMSSTEAPNVDSHYGFGTGRVGSGGGSREEGGSPVPGYGRSMMTGRGMGGGGGSGGGSGMGRGLGGGRGRGMGGGMGGSGGQGEQVPFSERMRKPSRPSTDSEVEKLENEKGKISSRLDEIKNRMGRMEGPTDPDSVIADVDEEVCVGCGLCEEVCPEGAITINAVAEVDSNKCTGCGECVSRCPQGAITLREGKV